MQDIICFPVMERSERTLAGKPVSGMKSGLIPTITRSQPLFHFQGASMLLYKKYSREKSLSDVLIDRHVPVTESGCWLWVANCTPQGYGVVRYKGAFRLAHRASYEEFVGAIPDGMVLDHLCKVTCCINPSHLEAVTQKVNVMRGDSITKAHAEKTHCKYGHEFNHLNTYVRPDGKGRVCIMCRDKRKRSYVLNLNGKGVMTCQHMMIGSQI